MSENKFCVSRNILILFLLLVTIIGSLYLANRLFFVKTGFFSRAASPKNNNNQALTPIPTPNILYLDTNSLYWKSCGFTYEEVKSYPNFKLNEPLNSFNNSYASFETYMAKWFVDIFYSGSVLNLYEYGPRNVIDRSLNVYNPKLNMNFYHKKCGLFEIALRRLMSNYKNKINPQKTLNELIFLSGGTVYKDAIYPSLDTFFPTNNTPTGIAFPTPICGFDPADDIIKYPSKPTPTPIQCIPLESIDQRYFNVNNSYIYRYANESLSEKILAKLFVGEEDLKRRNMKIGIIYPKPIQFLIEKFVLKPVAGYALKEIQVEVDKQCMNTLSIDPAAEIFCGFNVYDINPISISKRITEAKFGPNSINPKFIRTMENVYSTYQALSFIRGFLPTGEEVFLGDDFSTLDYSEQRKTISTIVAEANKNSIKTELEVGHGGIYTFCKGGNVCIKTDLMAKPLDQYNLGDGVIDPGYSAFFTVDARTIPSDNKFDLIYMISPFPLGNNPDQRITEETATYLVQNLKPGGKLVIIYDPVFNESTIKQDDSRISTEQTFEILSKDLGCSGSNESDCSSGFVFGEDGLAAKNPDVYIFKFMDSEFFAKYFSDFLKVPDIKQIVKALIYTKPK